MDVIATALTQAATTVCGMKRSIRKPRISSQSIQLMDYRSEIPVSVSYDPTRATITHQPRRSLREDREHWWRKRAAAMEAAHASGDTRQLFLLIRSSGHNDGSSETICKSDGTPIIDQRPTTTEMGGTLSTTVHLYNSAQ